MISVVIPVYNKWELTRDCLVSLARTGPEDMEVIVVDNASSDKTALACEPTGKALFGERFQYLRQEVNRNFAGACNIGARAAQGEWLFLLNNDTLHEPNWAEPLIHALQEDPTLGAVGPLLLYPEDRDGVRRVQHLGVITTLSEQIRHLYHKFPITHPLIQKQRYFQIITGAAFLLSSTLFQQLGGFDESYVNDLEDVDFCIRLHRAGYRMSCIPSVRMEHLCGQSRGKSTANHQENLQYFKKKWISQSPFLVNEISLLQADGYILHISPWLTFSVGLSVEKEQKLLRTMREAENEDTLRRMLLEEPYWMEGYKRLAAIYEHKNAFVDAIFFLKLAGEIQPDPEIFCSLHRLASCLGLDNINVLSALKDYCLEPQERLQRLRVYRCEFKHAFPSLAEDADALLATESRFFAEQVEPLRQYLLQTENK